LRAYIALTTLFLFSALPVPERPPPVVFTIQRCTACQKEEKNKESNMSVAKFPYC